MKFETLPDMRKSSYLYDINHVMREIQSANIPLKKSDETFINSNLDGVRMIHTAIAHDAFMDTLKKTRFEFNNHLTFPQVLPAPIGALDNESIIVALNDELEVAANTTLHNMSQIRQRYGGKTDKYRLNWSQGNTKSSLLNAVKSVVLHKSENHYAQGIANTLFWMTEDKWNTKILYTFLALNKFLDGNTADTVTFAKFLSDQETALEQEFNTFNGLDNTYTRKLVEVWGDRLQILTPRAANLTKMLKLMGQFTPARLRTMLDNKAFNANSSRNTIKSQPLMLESVLNAAEGGNTLFEKKEVRKILTTAMFNADRERSFPTEGTINKMGQVISSYRSAHGAHDVNSSVIIDFLSKNSKEFTLIEMLAVLYGAYKGSPIVSDGAGTVGKHVISKIIQETQDPVAGLRFIADTVLHYDGTLPTNHMWGNLIKNDKEDPIFNMSPVLVFQLFTGNAKRAVGSLLEGFRSAVLR